MPGSGAGNYPAKYWTKCLLYDSRPGDHITYSAQVVINEGLGGLVHNGIVVRGIGCEGELTVEYLVNKYNELMEEKRAQVQKQS